MRKQYDFSTGRKSAYAKRLKQRITIRLDADTIRYFKRLAAQTGMSFEALINLYLRECANPIARLEWPWRICHKAIQTKSACSTCTFPNVIIQHDQIRSRALVST